MKLGAALVFSLIILMIVPAYGDVISFSLEKASYITTEKFAFAGLEGNGTQPVFITIRNPTGGFVGMLADPASDADGNFLTIPRPVKDFFTSEGIYNATAFSENQNEKGGLTIQIEYDGNKILVLPDFELKLNTIPTKTIEEKKTLIFTASLSDATLKDVSYSLEGNIPTGLTINNSTGEVTWTPTETQGPASYLIDIVVKKGGLVDRQTVTISVTDPPAPTPTPEPTPKPSQPTPEPTSEPEEIDIAPFVDPKQDPQYYVDRYNNEPNYKDWFDRNYAEYSSIYEAVGLEEPEIKEPEFGECGVGTKLIDGICEVVEASSGGGWLIATAAYGSEMAPQVQLLREIRDDKVLNTVSGSSFMTAFNTFYYSFSPTIADWERESPVFKEFVKLGLTPLLTSLSILNHVDINSEQEMLGYGIGIILMNVGIYFVAPAIIIFRIKNR